MTKTDPMSGTKKIEVVISVPKLRVTAMKGMASSRTVTSRRMVIR